MARQISVDLVSDTKAFERGMASATASTDKFEKELKSTESSASKFDSALDGTTDKLEGATGKFRSTADLAGGLGDVLGISAIGPIASYATGMADIADGLGGLLAPALAKSKAAFLAMNTTLMANPIFLVIAAVAALGIAFVVAYKKSETFRNIVDGAMDGVKDAVLGMWHAIQPIFKLWKAEFNILADAVEMAVSAIKSAWNNTIGGRGIHIPSINLGFTTIGGGGFDIPMLAKGGPLGAGQAAIVGERGPELFVPNTAGTVVPNGAGMGASVTVVISTGASDLDELIRKRVRILGAGNVQKAYGY